MCAAVAGLTPTITMSCQSLILSRSRPAWFWGNSAYAVVYCVCRDYLGMDISKAAFEKMVERLPYTKNRPYKCLPCTIANAFKNNPIFLKRFGLDFFHLRSVLSASLEYSIV